MRIKQILWLFKVYAKYDPLSFYKLFIESRHIFFPFKTIHRYFLRYCPSVPIACISLNVINLYLSYYFSYIYYIMMHINALHDLFIVLCLDISLITYQYQLIILILLLSFLSMLFMLVLVLIKSELDQARIFQYTCCKTFKCIYKQ